jgi:hypothetical protein
MMGISMYIIVDFNLLGLWQVHTTQMAEYIFQKRKKKKERDKSGYNCTWFKSKC